MSEAKSATECIIFIPFHNNNTTRTPPVDPLFFFFFSFSDDDEGTTSLWVRIHPRAYTCSHHRVAHTANRWLAEDFPWCSGASQRVTDLSRGGGAARGLAGRRDASWHVAESVILRGRPGTQKKNGAAIYLILCSLASFRVESFWPWYHVAVSWAVTWWYCHLSKLQVSSWIIMWSLANAAEPFCLSLFKPTFTLLSKSNVLSINLNVPIHNKCWRYSLSRLCSSMNTLT